MGKRGPKPRNPEVRFLGLTKIDPVTSCWIWQGHRNNMGYGLFYVRPGKVMSAHRWAYLHWKGEIPAGRELDHLCRVRACANADHLEPVTTRENGMRGLRGRLRVPPTHCAKGHELTADNIYIEHRGDRTNRLCLTCKRASGRATAARRRAKRRAAS